MCQQLKRFQLQLGWLIGQQGRPCPGILGAPCPPQLSPPSTWLAPASANYLGQVGQWCCNVLVLCLISHLLLILEQDVDSKQGHVGLCLHSCCPGSNGLHACSNTHHSIPQHCASGEMALQ